MMKNKKGVRQFVISIHEDDLVKARKFFEEMETIHEGATEEEVIAEFFFVDYMSDTLDLRNDIEVEKQ